MARIRLRIGISLAYALIMIPLTLGMVGYLYQTNAAIIVANATDIMRRTMAVVSRDVESLILPVARAVENTAEIARTNRGSLQTVQGLEYFYRQISALPQLYSMFIGFEGTGHFYQAIAIPPELKKLGPSSQPLPDDARYALRLLDDSSGKTADSFILYGDWGDVKKVDRGPATYDPRKRPWYGKAWDTPGVSISEAYVFASSGLVGMTLSHRIETQSGVAIGTVGADITFDTLSAFLKKAAIGKTGQVFLLDSRGNLVAHPDPRLGVRLEDGKVRLRKAAEIQGNIVGPAVRARAAGQAGGLQTIPGPDGEDYLVSFAPLDTSANIDWTIGVVVQKDELVGPLRRTSTQILIAGGIVILVAIFAIGAFSRRLTGPIQRIVQETERIRHFELDGESLESTSNIVEVHQLTKAVATMKHSLKTFSIYVPKELVRLIVSGGDTADVGTRRQKLTVLFSDIEGFTNISEDLPPERLAASLSEYFERMSSAIHDNKGVVDKFIGDAIMAIWNAPVADPDHVANACRALLACRDAGKRLAGESAETGQPSFRTRFGLHTGEAVVGNVGSSDRTQYSAFGAMVNLTARLEALNKAYGTRLLVSGGVVDQVGDAFLFRFIDRVVPVGISTPVPIFELLAARDAAAADGSLEETIQCRDAWGACIRIFESRNWPAARESFAAYKEAYPEDAVAEVMIRRCERFETDPPPPDWDGATRFDTK